MSLYITKGGHVYADRVEVKIFPNKPYRERYPGNMDSIGIEIVGMAIGPDLSKTYENVTDAQNTALKWLVRELVDTWRISLTEVFRHPVVSRRNLTEASTAQWR
jgi:N-acetyl-anhydromuramyl-L-alanine amidase AmpD